MSRRARLTVLELGASPNAWASCHGFGTDDFIVIAQQGDEGAAAFTQRVRHRAERLRREDAQIESLDVYASPRSDRQSSAARRGVIEELGVQLAQGGRLTLWSAAEDARGDAELSAILAQFGPVLAKRQIAVNHQAWGSEEASGVRHAIPARPARSIVSDDFEFEELG